MPNPFEINCSRYSFLLSPRPPHSSHGDQRRNATRAVASGTHCPLIACTHGSLSKYGIKEDRQDEASIRPQENVSTSESRHPSRDRWSPRGRGFGRDAAGHVASHRPELSPRKLQSIESRKQLADLDKNEKRRVRPPRRSIVPEKEGPRKTSSREAKSVFSAETVSKLEQRPRR